MTSFGRSDRFDMWPPPKLLSARVSQLEARMTAVESALVAIDLRLDRMFLALVGGLIVIVAAMVGTALMP